MLPIHMETEISPVGSTGNIYPVAFESNSDVLTLAQMQKVTPPCTDETLS